MATAAKATPRLEKLLNERPSLAEVCEHVRTSKWLSLGIQLKLNELSLEDIKLESSDKLTLVYQLWFRTQPNASRRQLVACLRTQHVGEHQLANEYEQWLDNTDSQSNGVSQQISNDSKSCLKLRDSFLLSIAQKIVTWEHLGMKLGLNPAEIEHIKRDNEGDYAEQKLQMLYKWHQKNGHEATDDKLIETALSIDLRELAEEIAKITGTEIKEKPQTKEQNHSLVSHDKVSDIMIVQIAEEIISWETLGIPMGLTSGDIEIIRRNFRGDYGRQKVELLFKWRQKNGAKATYKHLIEIFESIEMKDLADTVRDSIKDKS